MAGKIRFPMKDVLVLMEHAQKCKRHRYGVEHLFDPSYLKEGEVMPEEGYARPEQIDMSKIEPALILVRDHGVYLMSNGLPALPGDKTENKVVYAKGFNPDVDDFNYWYDTSADIFGGDDVSMHLPVGMFTIWGVKKPEADEVVLVITRDAVALDL